MIIIIAGICYAPVSTRRRITQAIIIALSLSRKSSEPFRFVYAVKVKRHNVCKRHVAIDTGFKQTERTICLCVISMGKI